MLLAASSIDRVGCMQEGRYRSGIGSDAVMMAVPVPLIGEGVQLALTHLIELPGKFDVCRDVQVCTLGAVLAGLFQFILVPILLCLCHSCCLPVQQGSDTMHANFYCECMMRQMRHNRHDSLGALLSSAAQQIWC